MVIFRRGFLLSFSPSILACNWDYPKQIFIFVAHTISYSCFFNCIPFIYLSMASDGIQYEV